MGKETAEQKLLKLIEANDAPGAGAAPAASSAPAAASSPAKETLAAVKGGGMSFSPGALIQQVLSIFQGAPAGVSMPTSFGLREINLAMTVAVLILGWVFARTLMGGLDAGSREIDFSLARKPEIKTRELFKPLKDLASYLALAQQRNIFTPYVEKVVEAEAEAPAPVPNQMINDRIKTLRLVGVSWLDSPETVTVMIEDTDSKITHFLKEGEEIKGVRVKTIFSDRVELSYQGESAMMGL